MLYAPEIWQRFQFGVVIAPVLHERKPHCVLWPQTSLVVVIVPFRGVPELHYGLAFASSRHFSVVALWLFPVLAGLASFHDRFFVKVGGGGTAPNTSLNTDAGDEAASLR